MEEETELPAPAAAPGWRRRVLRVGLIALAVLLAIVSLAPAFVSAFGRGYAEDVFARRYQGRLEIGGLDLSWTGRQRVREARLLTPDGKEVARGDLVLPSLLALARGRGVRLGTLRARARADLVADDDGTTNLDRALAPRLAPPAQGPPAPPTADAPQDEPAGDLERLALSLELELERFTWEDAATRAAGEPLTFENVRVLVGLDGGGALTARADGAILGAPGGGLHLDLRVENAFADPESESPPRFELDADLAEVPVALFDGVLGGEGLLLDLMGPRARLTARAEGGLEAGDLDLELGAERLQVSARAALEDGVLRTREGTTLEATLAVHEDLCARLSADYLPPGTAVDFGQAAGAVTLRLRDLALPLDALSAPLDLEALADAARAALEIELSPLHYAGGAGADALELAFDSLRLSLDLAPESGLAARLGGGLRGARRDGLDLSLRSPRPADLARWADGGTLSTPVIVEGRVAGLPTALVDRLAEQDGLLVDMLGDTLELRIAGSFPDEQAPLELELRSPRAHVDLTALLSEGTLTASGDQGLEAESALTPLYTQRVVGRLLPLLVGLDKPDDAPPVGLSVKGFTLPLDGDLAKLNARITLDLNLVRYRMLPGVEELVTGLAGERAVTLEPIVLEVRQGIVSYERLDLKFGDETLLLRGSFDLATSRLNLNTEVPLSALGEKVGAQLDKVRDYIDPRTRVPISLQGTWKRPRLSIGEGFLESVLEDAAKGALRRGLRDLIDRR